MRATTTGWPAKDPSPLNGDPRRRRDQRCARSPTAPSPRPADGLRCGRARNNAFGGEDTNLEDFVAAGLSLADYLTEQLHVVVTDPAERLIGAHLIHTVDEAGYLRGDLDELADKLGAPAGLIDKVLGVLQGFDPPGVFARDLAECLALQLKDQNRYDPQIAKLLDNLALLGGHNLAALKRAVGVDAEELADMIAEIKRLNPKPGLQFGTIQIQPVLPDVMVRPARDGSWIVELNNDTLPRVLVNRSYYTTVSKSTRSEQDRGYLLDCLQSANWLVKSLDQRARTILRVAEEIVRQQDGFLTYGIAHLKPLNLKTVADAISMHEFDGQPRHLQQVHGDAARRVRAQVFLHLRHRLVGRRGGALLRSRAPPHPPADRCGAGERGAVRRQDRRAAEARRYRHRPAHRGQVSRGAAHPLLRAASTREADGGAPRRQPVEGGNSHAFAARGPAIQGRRVGCLGDGCKTCSTPFDSEWLLIYGPPRVAATVDQAERAAAAPPEMAKQDTGPRVGQDASRERGLQGICRGLLRFDQEGTRKTPRERCIVMRYPRGISHTSDGDDVLTPAHGRAQAAFGARALAAKRAR